MKKLKLFLNRIPRPARVLLDLILTALLLFFCYLAAGAPPLSEESAFRRAEKANLVGPASVLDIVTLPSDWVPAGYQKLLVADAGDEILFYTYYLGTGTSSTDGVFVRREKTDGFLLTVLPMETTALLSYRPSSTYVRMLPVFLFTDRVSAARAELHFTLSERYEVTLSADRRDAAWFTFEVPLTKELWFSIDKDRMADLIATNSFYTKTRGEYPAQIRLYNAEGVLLEERELSFRSRLSP
ncbi:MAG: hypothetical protein IKI82_05770 [Lachnospiraceae bacterium]|nr:hypothetical protein [Lachnospiraceae bacterium]